MNVHNSSSIFNIELYFDTEGNIIEKDNSQKVIDIILSKIDNLSVTDLLVFSHGWNNDVKEAKENFYDRMLLKLGKELLFKFGSERTFLTICIFWPSKKFTSKSHTHIGAASISDITDMNVVNQLNDLFADVEYDNIDDVIENLASSSAHTESSTEDTVELLENFDILLKLVPKIHFFSEPENDILKTLDLDQGRLILKKLIPYNRPQPSESGGAAGSASRHRAMELFITPARAIANLLTYYMMKERAAIIGAYGLSPVLKTLKAKYPNLKIHLIGHSFGARLVTAAAAKLPLSIQTLSLLQAAFSQYSFAKKYDKHHEQLDGIFRNVVTDPCVSGPIIVTHSRQDYPVSYFYAIASQLAGQVAETFGDSNDFYGSLGSNGAQETPEAETVPLGNDYIFERGKLYNIDGNYNEDGRDYIHNHSDVTKTGIINAIIQSIYTA